MTQRRIFPAFLAATALALASCASDTTAQSSGTDAPVTEGKMSVYASFYPLQYLSEQIGGDMVSVESLTPPGAEPHDLELSPAKVAQLEQADAVVFLSGFQSAVDKAVAHNGPEHIIDVAPAVQLIAGEHDHDHAHDHSHDDHDHGQSGHDGHNHDGHNHDHGQSGHDDHDHAHESRDHSDQAASGAHDDHDHADHDHGHDHGDQDPHFWLDPQRMAQAATAIGQAFAKADPENAQTYTTNAATVAKSMNELATELVEGTKSCEHTTFVTAHDAFGYLADRTGLTQVGISGLDPDSSPSPARLAEVAKVVKDQGLTTIFTETLIDPKVSETLAADLGITTAVLDPLESQADDSKDYMDVMRENIAALRKALTCK
ncbi:metal ABC transporter solute-binding protein, Zn/Mn family [Schaalia sp. Marseille-Q2122]|uniref:metal ABC transporter solute-binding protein, Zn/Mn family n=1 Tax=Schaalia sp. Marseille-Q2122 TaxID=2736604 RepID=UPI00158D3ECC|nr:metal ABC transporter substrate-binding protein [Schaalia sp. Marseille-Q2122]